MKQQHEKLVMDDPALEHSRGEFSPPHPPEESSFLELLLKLSEWKLFILKFVAVCTIVSAVVALVWPKSYTSIAKIMPPQQSQSIATAMMGQLGPLAALAGKDLGVRTASDIYLYVLKSRTIADHLIDKFDLMKVYRDKKRVDALDDLHDNTRISSGSEGGITIAVTDHDPQRAADLANAYVDELKKLTQSLAVTEAGRRRIFFEHEVQEANEELAEAELALKTTQEKTGLIHLDSQARSMMDALVKLHEQVAAKDAQVQAMRSFATAENPDLVRAESELSALRRELARLEAGQGGNSLADINLRKVPESGLEYMRSLRDVKYKEAVMEALAKQYEIARVDEGKDAAIIQVLDKGMPPEIRSSPKRTLIVLTTAFLALFVAIAMALWMERAKEDPIMAARLQLLRFRLMSGPKTRAG